MITKPKAPLCDSTCKQAIQKAIESRLNATQAYLATQLPPSQFPPESRLAKSVSIIYRDQPFTFVAGNTQLIDGHPITPTHRFAVGSTGKMFTATLVYQLERMGWLKITDLVSEHLPKGFLPQEWQNITIYEALHMSDGSYDYGDAALKKELIARAINHNDTIYSPVELISYAYNKGPLCKPEYDPDHTFAHGEGWCYSNTVYRILELMIEFVGGKSYQEQLQERILTPLGMNHTIYDPSINPATLSDMTHGYCALISEQLFLDGTNSTSLISQAGGAGSHISTPSDMSIFTHALFSGKIFPLDSKQFKEFTTVVCTNPEDGCIPGKEVPLGMPSDAYGSGLRRIIQRPGDPPTWFSSGSIGIQPANIFSRPEDGLTVTICSNAEANGADLPDPMDNGLFGDIYRALNITQDKSVRPLESRQSVVEKNFMITKPKPIQEPETYLLKPTGKRGVSAIELTITNPNSCPDTLCAVDGGDPTCNSHITDFDVTSNPKLCHAMNLRVSYPTNGTVQLGDPYYPPKLRKYHDFLKKIQPNIPGLSDEMIEPILKMRSYSTENLPIMPGKFPVIFLAPGHGEPSQFYENVANELVSQGYIVVGISSTFVNLVALPDKPDYQHVVEPLKVSDPGVLFKPQQQDILYILHNLSKFLPRDLYLSMNLTRTGFLGHSLGASVLADLVHDDPSLAQALAPLERCQSLYEPIYTAPTISPKVPVFNVVAGFRENYPASFPLERSQTLLRIAPSPMSVSDMFTSHMSISDLETIQDQPGLKLTRQYYAQRYPNLFDTGTGDGQIVAHAISINVGKFFDLHLSGIPSRELQSCIPLFPNSTTVCCGPGVCNTTVVDQMPILPKSSHQTVSQTNSVTPNIEPPKPIVRPETAPIVQSTADRQAEPPLNNPTIPPVTSGASRLEAPAPIRWIASGLRSVGGFFSGLFSHSPTVSANSQPSTALVLDDSIRHTSESSEQIEEPRFTNNSNSSAENVRAVVDTVNNAGAYLGLGMVLWNLGSSIYHWSTTPSQPVTFATDEKFRESMQALQHQLKTIKNRVDRFFDLYKQPEIVDVIQEESESLYFAYKDFSLDFNELKGKGHATAEELSELEEDLTYLSGWLSKEGFIDAKERIEEALSDSKQVTTKELPASFSLQQRFWQPSEFKPCLPPVRVEELPDATSSVMARGNR